MNRYTRPRVHLDRAATAWSIDRLVDPHAALCCVGFAPGSMVGHERRRR